MAKFQWFWKSYGPHYKYAKSFYNAVADVKTMIVENGVTLYGELEN